MSLSDTQIVCIFPIVQLAQGRYYVIVENEDFTSAMIDEEITPILMSYES